MLMSQITATSFADKSTSRGLASPEAQSSFTDLLSALAGEPGGDSGRAVDLDLPTTAAVPTAAATNVVAAPVEPQVLADIPAAIVLPAAVLQAAPAEADPKDDMPASENPTEQQKPAEQPPTQTLLPQLPLIVPNAPKPDEQASAGDENEPPEAGAETAPSDAHPIPTATVTALPAAARPAPVAAATSVAAPVESKTTFKTTPDAAPIATAKPTSPQTSDAPRGATDGQAAAPAAPTGARSRMAPNVPEPSQTTLPARSTDAAMAANVPMADPSVAPVVSALRGSDQPALRTAPHVLSVQDPNWPADAVRLTLAELTPDGGTMEIELNPGSLGPLRISLTVDGETAHVTIRTETAEAAQALAEAEPQLAQELSRAGVTLESSDTRADPPAGLRGDGRGDPRGHAPPGSMGQQTGAQPYAPDADPVLPLPKAGLLNLIA